ncbi:MAG: WXG100 family type VII secretion target [Lachnospiraceae bacterium]|nr:WXG100 family type VII secretion target [Lachnospiraceae bacterium]
MANIRFNYNQTLQQAEKLEKMASTIQSKTMTALDEISRNVQAAWSGEASDVFRRYLARMKEDLGAKASYLKKTADFLRTAAKKMKEAEMAAQQSARRI